MHEECLIKHSALVPSHNRELDKHIPPHNGPLLLITLTQSNQPYREGGRHKTHSENKKTNNNKNTAADKIKAEALTVELNIKNNLKEEKRRRTGSQKRQVKHRETRKKGLDASYQGFV